MEINQLQENQEEISYEKEIQLVVDPKQYAKQQEGVDVETEIIQSSFVYLLIGKPGSGKTQLIREQLMNPKLYFKKFDKVRIFSPYPLEGCQCKLNKNYWNEFNLDKIYEIIDGINSKTTETSPWENLLFIFDDVINDLDMLQYDKRLRPLFFNRRNLLKRGTISYIITTQKFILFPSKLRTCITAIYLFQCIPEELKTIIQQMVYMPKSQFNKLYNQTIACNKHDFLFIREDGNIYYLFKLVYDAQKQKQYIK